MICPRCGRPTSLETGRCTRCGASVGESAVLTGVLPIDTTGLPPGATFGASTSRGTLAGATIGDAPTGTIGVGPAAIDPGPLKVGQSFGPRYHIIKLLGAGGMGAVYQAWDAELSVAVALKVIRVDKRKTASSEAEKRFKQELLLARQVTHKHVVRIHDLGEIDGIKYLTMPYVQGADLATLLREEAKLPIAQALPLARQIAAGLQAAHEAGVVHRDLKPANIMISGKGDERQALIMDFGISASADSTDSGSVVGTLEYMAPEQAKGLADARSDIYAFGLIVYEMLTGPRLLRDATPQARVEAMRLRCTEGLAPIRVIDSSIAEPLEQFVMKCVATDPAARFQNATELAAALGGLTNAGHRVPIAARVTKPVAAAIAMLVLMLLGGTYYVTRTLVTPTKAHDPVSVVIADLSNQTGDAEFRGTLEPMLKRALEGAGFISAYYRNGLGPLGVKPPDQFDEAAARELAVNQGLGVVLSGAIARAGSGYDVTIKASQSVAGSTIATAKGRASSKEQVLAVATRLIATIRKALGDRTSESEQMFAMASISATSLPVIQQYAAAQEAASNNRFEEAMQSASRAVQLDPTFGVGYQLLAISSRNVGRLEDANKYIKEALRYLDRMTERERFSTRGFYDRLTGDYEQCVKEYGELVDRYAGDPIAHNQRALCLSKLRNMREAVDEMQSVVRILPKRAAFRDNLALYAAYAGDFDRTDRELDVIERPDAYATLARGFAHMGRGHTADAVRAFEQLRSMGALGASFGASAIADAALYEGRLAEAAKLFEDGAAADLAAKNGSKAAMKFASAGYAQMTAGRKREAIAAAGRALDNSKSVSAQFLAARILVDAGAIERARAVATSLQGELTAEPQAFGKILAGDLALQAGHPRDAIKLLNEANALLDTWIGHFDLGRAYLAASALPQADSEFDRCLKRRGESLSLFVDEEPTSGYFPPVYYYQGRVREALGTSNYADAYRAYLDIRGKSTEDPLVADVNRRIAR